MQHTWADAQAAFAAALIDPRLPPPPGVIECGSGRRNGFAVYRNNALVTLIDALQERFPVTCQLVGEEFFRAMARAYASEHRPRSPLLFQYGNDFPIFVAGFMPAEDVPYLSDVARLEVAWSAAYHAPEASPLQPHALTETAPDAVFGMRLTLHPSTQILRSPYPVADVWAAHQHANSVTPPTSWDGQDILVVRPDAEVHVHTLGPGTYAFMSALLDRKCVQDAAEIACIGASEFDAGENIVNLFRMGGVIALVDAQEKQL